MNKLAWLTWDPPRELFTIPYFNHPITWYGICFITGFILGFLLLVPMFAALFKRSPSPRKMEPRKLAVFLTDKLTWYVMLGTVVGARLGHVFFYEWPCYRDNPLAICKIWEGGLASHGGTVGIIAALWLFSRRYRKQHPEISLITLMDLLAVPTALAAFCIRIGNFINQEIVGPQTTVPWAIVFGHPYRAVGGVPRHPVQLYEAACYLTVFVILWGLWKVKGDKIYRGSLAGSFLILVFGSRFFLEFFKNPMSVMFDESLLQTGQLLSLPFIFLGVLLVGYGYRENSFNRTIESQNEG